MNGDPASRIIAAIGRKRAGHPLSSGEIEQIVDDFVAGRTPEYQMSALLATIACRGLDLTETVALTRAYVHSGEMLRPDRPAVDKHSTGGVGDKVTLVVAPVVAACGVPVSKLSGRGLGFAGGTIDKLESIRGLRLHLDAAEIRDVLAEAGMVIAGHSATMVPGDGATYALRDVTGTVESIPLIAASVMSKKIACGPLGVVLDVKYGDGALVPDPSEARELAGLMLAVGREFGLPCRALLSDMSRPLGRAVGNALEVKEALAVLGGADVPGLTALCDTIATLMLQIGRPGLDDAEAGCLVREARTSGAARLVFRRWVEAQGGAADQIDDPDRLPAAANRDPVRATASGWVQGIQARPVGEAAALVGAGRLRLGDALDLGAGVQILRQVGEPVRAGEPVAELHWTAGAPQLARDLLAGAFRIGSCPPRATAGFEVLDPVSGGTR